MTAEPTGVPSSVPVAARSAAETSSRRTARRLPVMRVRPTWQLLAIQVGMLLFLIVAWEVGADLGFVDAFFWSKPSLIGAAMLIYFESGSALVDILYTFRSTLLGFALGTVLGAGLGLSF